MPARRDNDLPREEIKVWQRTTRTQARHRLVGNITADYWTNIIILGLSISLEIWKFIRRSLSCGTMPLIRLPECPAIDIVHPVDDTLRLYSPYSPLSHRDSIANVGQDSLLLWCLLRIAISAIASQSGDRNFTHGTLCDPYRSLFSL